MKNGIYFVVYGCGLAIFSCFSAVQFSDFMPIHIVCMAAFIPLWIIVSTVIANAYKKYKEV